MTNKKLKYLKTPEQLIAEKKRKELIAKRVKEELNNVKYNECINKINTYYLVSVSDILKDYVLLKDKVKKIIVGKKECYVGTTHDYKQRFCGIKEVPDSHISKNAHNNNGYTKMYVLGRATTKDLICKFEKKLIADFKEFENESPHCLGLEEGLHRYYVYIVVKD